MKRLWLVALTACAPLEQPIDVGPTPAGDGGVDPPPDPADRRLVLQGCGGLAPEPALVGPWVFRVESAAVLTGADRREQPEWTTRYGIAELCQDGAELQIRVLVCALAQSPVFDDADRTCAAQVPDAVLVAALPGDRLEGTFDTPTPGGRVTLSPWLERWGLDDDATTPAEPTGATQLLDAPGVIDQDEDGHPGVTLRGDGPVPTISWAARQTSMNLTLEIVDERTLAGITASQTNQAILGGPAARALRGRRRGDAAGQALFYRADGTVQTPLLDANGDGVATCAELAPFLGPILPPPRPTDACIR